MSVDPHTLGVFLGTAGGFGSKTPTAESRSDVVWEDLVVDRPGPHEPTSHIAGMTKLLPSDCDELLDDADLHNTLATLAATNGWTDLSNRQAQARDEALSSYCEKCQSHQAYEQRCGEGPALS